VENLGVNETFWRERPVLVTGAAGLVGGWLTRSLLDCRADVVCLIRDWVPQSEVVRAGMIDRVKVVRGDVRERDLLERVLGEYEINTVFHLAAQAVVAVANRNAISTFESNIQGTWNLLEACRRSPEVKAVVVASSDKAYGSQQTLPYSEDTPLQGEHPYDVSKSCADLIAQSYGITYKLPVVITRCGNFYGGGDLNWNRIVPGTVRSVIRGEAPVIRSDGHYIRDYFYVEDGAAAYMLLARHLVSCPDEQQISVLELVNRILRQMGCSLKPDVRNEASNEIRHQYLSAERARRMLNWAPAFTLDEGLKKTISWYQEFLIQ
jgi:CDP-glucose 4,6-dehydratase